jgi:microcin C transport system substrate-binding protein
VTALFPYQPRRHQNEKSMRKNILFTLCLLWGSIQTTLADTPAPASCLSSSPPAPFPTHGFSTYGKLKYPENFTHFGYTNPNAPKGGTLRLGNLGTFDSLNPYIVKGVSPNLIGLTTATLLEEAYDRAGEAYAYAAESLELAPDRSWVIFRLNPKATFSNGESVTADDVIWVFETLRTKGLPMYRTYYKNISKVEKLDDKTIKFTFNTTKDRELPLILGQLPILSKKYYETHPFEETTLKAGPSSGPYQVDAVSSGHFLVVKRVKNWWGEAIPSQKGRYNFATIRLDYYLENNAWFEGFKSGQYDLRQEGTAKNWATAYNFPAFRKGLVKREELKSALSDGTLGFIFNTRRPPFSDIRVRKALTLLFDFPWLNKHIFYGLYQRNTSYYPNSNFEAKGAPSEEEKAILQPFQDQLPPEVLTQSFTLPSPQTETDHRTLQEQAQNLLKDAGYELKDTIMVNKETGKPLTFEILIADKALEKIILNFASSVQRLGIHVNVRNLDVAAYELRVNNLDFDMIYSGFPQSSSLGNEQRDFFGSERANTPGTRNFFGIKNPVVDRLIEELIDSTSYKSLMNHAKALDRVLLWNYYMIPAWHNGVTRVAYWNHLSRPEVTPKYHPLDITTWWFDAKKEAGVKVEPEEKKPSSPKPLWKRIKDKIRHLWGHHGTA